MPPPAGRAVADALGTEAHLRDLFGDGIASLEVTERTFTFRFRSAEAFVDFFRLWYGPTVKAFAARRGRRRATRSSATSSPSSRGIDRLGPGAVAIPATYTEAVAIKR